MLVNHTQYAAHKVSFVRLCMPHVSLVSSVSFRIFIHENGGGRNRATIFKSWRSLEVYSKSTCLWGSIHVHILSAWQSNE